MINLVMGLTKIPLRRFYWVSQLGMLPGTIVFVNAGRELAKIDSLRGILSPGLLISFVLIGIFPIAVKKLVALYRGRGEQSQGSSNSQEEGGSSWHSMILIWVSSAEVRQV